MNSEFKEQERRGFDSWGMGAVLIGVGAVLLFSNFTGFRFDNWWVLFTIFPLVSFFAGAWRDYQANGRLTNTGVTCIISGLGILVFAAVILIDGISWGAIWPIAFVFGGITLLLNRS